MRINKYIAQQTGLSRRAVDIAIQEKRVLVNNNLPAAGQLISDSDDVKLDGQPLKKDIIKLTIMINKPVGYVVSRDGQGSRTVYDLLPNQYRALKPVGRLDKDSSGLLLLTNDGNLAHELTHPKFQKLKKYKIALNKNLSNSDMDKITKTGVALEDGISRFDLEPINQQPKEWKVEMKEGRNRQIRRTFEAIGYKVVKLHRTHIGPYELRTLTPGKFEIFKI